MDNEPHHRRERQAAADKHAAERYANDIRWLMSDPRGRRVLAKLFERAGMHRTSFTGNSTTFFNEGARNVGLQFEQDVLAAGCFEQYTTMLKEYQDDRRSNDNRTA